MEPSVLQGAVVLLNITLLSLVLIRNEYLKIFNLRQQNLKAPFQVKILTVNAFISFAIQNVITP